MCKGRDPIETVDACAREGIQFETVLPQNASLYSWFDDLRSAGKKSNKKKTQYSNKVNVDPFQVSPNTHAKNY